MNKKMIVSDLDGTLLDKNRKLTVKTYNYLKKLKEDGHIIAIATGRMMNNAVLAAEGADFADYIITDNGGVVFDVKNSKPLFKKTIPTEYINAICKFAKNKYINDFIIVTPNFHYVYAPFDSSKFNLPFCVSILDINEFLNNIPQTTRIVITPKDMNSAEIILNEIREKYSKLECFLMYDSFNEEERWIEILNKDTTKYNAIKEIAKIENISNENIIAFGDSTNDIEMISNCGIGVAMENAIDEVKEKADYIAPSHEEDGVIEFLKDYLKNY